MAAHQGFARFARSRLRGVVSLLGSVSALCRDTPQKGGAAGAKGGAAA